MQRFLMLNSASITENGSKSTIISRRKRKEIISQWLMIDDSFDTSKTDERNGSANYNGTILAGETWRPNPVQRS